jgi:hypothetical protein
MRMRERTSCKTVHQFKIWDTFCSQQNNSKYPYAYYPPFFVMSLLQRLFESLYIFSKRRLVTGALCACTARSWCCTQLPSFLVDVRLLTCLINACVCAKKVKHTHTHKHTSKPFKRRRIKTRLLGEQRFTFENRESKSVRRGSKLAPLEMDVASFLLETFKRSLHNNIPIQKHSHKHTQRLPSSQDTLGLKVYVERTCKPRELKGKQTLKLNHIYCITWIVRARSRVCGYHLRRLFNSVNACMPMRTRQS